MVILPKIMDEMAKMALEVYKDYLHSRNNTEYRFKKEAPDKTTLINEKDFHNIERKLNLSAYPTSAHWKMLHERIEKIIVEFDPLQSECPQPALKRWVKEFFDNFIRELVYEIGKETLNLIYEKRGKLSFRDANYGPGVYTPYPGSRYADESGITIGAVCGTVFSENKVTLLIAAPLVEDKE